jgi:hypothetical protein
MESVHSLPSDQGSCGGAHTGLIRSLPRVESLSVPPSSDVFIIARSFYIARLCLQGREGRDPRPCYLSDKATGRKLGPRVQKLYMVNVACEVVHWYE